MIGSNMGIGNNLTSAAKAMSNENQIGEFEKAINDIGDAIGIGAQRRQQEFDSAEAAMNRNWQEHMRDTEITSAYKQMEALGINPVLATGASVSAPSGAAASQSGNASINAMGVLNAMTNYIHAKNTAKMLQQTKETHILGKLTKTLLFK